MSDGAFLYRHFDKSGQLLYVGISLNAVIRLSQHRDSSHWYDQIARVDVEPFPSRVSALAAERSAVQKERPLHNRQLQRPPEEEKPWRAVKAIERPLLQLNPIYKLNEAAEKLRMSAGQLRKLIDAGDIGYIELWPPTTRVVEGQARVHRSYALTGWQLLEYVEHLERRTKRAEKVVIRCAHEPAGVNGFGTEASKCATD